MSPPRETERANPPFGVAHPLKVGRSVRIARSRRNPRRLPRDMLALKFAHVPDDASLNTPGVFTYSANRFTVEMGTNDGERTQVFSGPRWAASSECAVSDYVLVYADGAFWLERITDSTNRLRHDGPREGAPNPPSSSDNPDVDPDSWMASPADDEDSGSPITPEEDAVADDPSNVALPPPPNGLTSSTPQRSGYAGKTPSGPTMLRHDAQPRQPAQKSIASKSIAGKRVANINGPSSPRPTDDDDDDDEDPAVRTEEVIVEEEEEDADDDRASKSSSDDSDSSDSSDDSSEDSADYTSRSSSDDD